MYEILLEREDRILRLGWEETKEEAERKLLQYISNIEDTDFSIWIEKDWEE